MKKIVTIMILSIGLMFIGYGSKWEGQVPPNLTIRFNLSPYHMANYFLVTSTTFYLSRPGRCGKLEDSLGWERILTPSFRVEAFSDRGLITNTWRFVGHDRLGVSDFAEERYIVKISITPKDSEEILERILGFIAVDVVYQMEDLGIEQYVMLTSVEEESQYRMTETVLGNGVWITIG